MTLGPFLFAAPWALAALAALPLLWWLIRATPPAPQRTAFPPTRLLQGLKSEEQTRERAPWWLILFRALAAALMIIGFARPSLAPSPAELAGSGRTLIVIDDGWTSAPFWPQAREAAQAAASEAERANAPVFLLLTAPEKPARDPGEALTAADARARIARLEPRPWRPDRKDAAERLSHTSGRYNRIIWISDGLNDADTRAFADALAARGPVTARLPPLPARAIVGAGVTPNGVEVTARRARNGGPQAAVAAETIEGRALGAAELRFRGDELTAQARITLPPEIAARAARVRIVSEQSAGAVRVLPSGSGRPFVALVDAGGEGQTMLSELYYAERALAPYASLQHGSVSDLINARAQVLLLPDAAPVTPLDRTALDNWLQNGGVLVRFAGPRLANETDTLLPVRLRPGSRSLGGALAWEKPLGFAPFPDDSPFAGLVAPPDVTIRQQVLAEPASAAQARVWARLEDNSPLVTANAKGRGLIVLYHVSAGPTWSDLPLSGLFVEMLRRTIAFAGRADGAGERVSAGGPYTPTRLLDGFGVLTQASPDAQPIPADSFAKAHPSPTTPPGLYERSGISVAIDAAQPNEDLTPIDLPRTISL
ncbi:MAG: BatA domain-containing protein, partial [Pseudomonadota bacterium]